MNARLALALALGFALGCGAGDAPSPTAEVTASEGSAATAPVVAPSARPVKETAGYDGRFASDPKLGIDDVLRIPPDQLRIVRNEIYARHGRAFKSADLQAHFGAQPWYSADPAYSDARLTENDKANAALLKSFEGDSDRSKLGEVRDDDAGLTYMFVDGSHITVVADEDVMYGYIFETPRRYVSRGEWVVSWVGPETFDLDDAELKDLQAWTIDSRKKQLTRVEAIPRG